MAQAGSDFAAIYYPGIQSVFDYIAKNMNDQIQKINATSDAPKLKQLMYLYGVGNWTAGLAGPIDVCKISTSIAAVVGTMSSDNQNIAVKLITAVDNGTKVVLPTITNIHKFLDYKLYQKLEMTENADTLKAIAALYSA
jgi:hypothetical protein